MQSATVQKYQNGTLTTRRLVDPLASLLTVQEYRDAAGYSLHVTSEGYTVRHRDEWVYAAGTVYYHGDQRPQSKRPKAKHWRHAAADLRDHLQSAIIKAQRHQRGNQGA